MSSLALTFNGVTLSPISHKNQTWLSASELAKALGYSRSDEVSRIYRRNSDEFNDSMTCITLERQNGVTGELPSIQREIRIFSLRGCHLIAMFAKTEIAKQFRVWVLDILDKEVGQPIIIPTQKPPHTLQSVRQSVLKALHNRGIEGVSRKNIVNYSRPFRLLDLNERNKILEDMLFQKEIFIVHTKIQSGQTTKRIVHHDFIEKMMILEKGDNAQVMATFEKRIEDGIREICGDLLSKSFDAVLMPKNEKISELRQAHTDFSHAVNQMFSRLEAIVA